MDCGFRMHVYTIVTFAIFYLMQLRRSTIAAPALRTPMHALRPGQLHVREKQSRGKMQSPLHTIDSTAFRPTARPLIHMMVKNTNFTKMHVLATALCPQSPASLISIVPCMEAAGEAPYRCGELLKMHAHCLPRLPKFARHERAITTMKCATVFSPPWWCSGSYWHLREAAANHQMMLRHLCMTIATKRHRSQCRAMKARHAYRSFGGALA